MRPTRHGKTLLLAVSLTLAGASAGASMKVRQPLLEEAPAPTAPGAAAPGPAAKDFTVGTVVFARGGQIVAEIPGGAKDRERLLLFDEGFRRAGKLVVVRPLEKGVFLLEAQGSVSAAPGNRLAREPEEEAATRVLTDGRADGYREFLAAFPTSQYRPRVGRELFRLAVAGGYPTFPGTVIEGAVKLTEAVGREFPLSQVLIVLDRYVIARTDDRGRFRIEGLPKLDEKVRLKLRVKDPRFEMATPVEIELPGGTLGELTADLPVRVTPTVLAGRVLDERGAPLPRAEVWTSPNTVEALTDDEGRFRISRRKRGEGGGAADEPIFGGSYEVYAHRKGYGVERVRVAAESYRETRVPEVRLPRQDPLAEAPLPLDLDLRAMLGTVAGAQAPAGAGPKLNP